MTPPSGSQSADIKILVSEIQGVREDLKEIKSDIKCLTEWQTDFERHYNSEHVRVDSKADAANRRLDLLEPKVEKLEKAIRDEVQSIKDALHPLKLQAKIIVWVGVVLGMSIIGLIWSIIIGQAKVVFP